MQSARSGIYAYKPLGQRLILTALTVALALPPACFAQSDSNGSTVAKPTTSNPLPSDTPEPIKLTDDPNHVSPPASGDLAHPNSPTSSTAAGTAQSINLAEVRGKVVDSASNQPVRDARAVLSKIGEEHKRYQTDSQIDGTFLFSNIEPGDYNLTVSADDKLASAQAV